MLEQTEATPSSLSATIIEFYGGATNRVGVEETAYPHREAVYAINAIAMWADPDQDKTNVQWSRGLWEAMRPFSTGGVYVNFLGLGDDGEERVRSAYGPNYDRLARIKASYDPTNFFRPNQNTPPAG